MSTKTLFIGDLHLKAELILPILEPIIESEKIDQIIFLGDYVDDWKCQLRPDLYMKDLNFLHNWVEKYQDKIQFRFIIGNHDAAYLINKFSHYTVLPQHMSEIKRLLLQFPLQLAYQLNDDYLVSHAGFAYDLGVYPTEIYFQTFQENPKEYTDLLKKLYRQVGLSRGGTSKTPSCLWLDEIELNKYTEEFENKPKQIIGHTPTRTMWFNVFPTPAMHINVDTFSLTMNLGLYGIGEVLVYNHETKDLTVIETNYATAETFERLKEIRK